MRRLKLVLGAGVGVISALWFAAFPDALLSANFFAFRSAAIQFSGILAISFMSAAVILATRPRWPEGWLGGLDRMYRLHKWLGIGGLVTAILHWGLTQAPGLAVSLGVLAPRERMPHPVATALGDQIYGVLRGIATLSGEWMFYSVVILIAVALLPKIKYRWFFKSHRLMAGLYLVLAFHALVLTKVVTWTTPLGVVYGAILLGGIIAGVDILARGVGARRRVDGRVSAIERLPQTNAVEVTIAVPRGWQGHKAGQFAFVTFDRREGAHPFTLASAWDPQVATLRIVVKALGDYTCQIGDTVTPGQPVVVEGPYGCFTFDDDHPRQIWVGGGIGITPFLARLDELAERDEAVVPEVVLFHTVSAIDDRAVEALKAAARKAKVRLHLLIGDRDGRLSGDRIRQIVPGWREASLWFCGPAAFGRTLRADFAASGLAVDRAFHQELFAMR